MLEVRATREAFSFKGGITIRMLDNDSKTYALPVQFKQAADPYEEIPVAMRLEAHTAQCLMDQLWDCGLRPSEGTGSAGALAAVEKHLADMRTLAFHALKVGKA